jgi:biopolymer transport protein ExbB/TolQ
MSRHFPVEFVYQLFALLVSVLLVHAVYVGLIRPQAAAVLAAQAALFATDPSAVAERSLWVVLKDFEQEVCFILMLWGSAMVAYKARQVFDERRLFAAELLHIAEGQSLLPEDTRQFARSIEALPEADRERLLPQALLTALQRFRSTRNVQDVAEAVDQVCEARTDRLDSELSMIRYIAWAIPSIGFIGTVRGIGDALGLANQAIEGDITGVTASLGVAFNSTLIALILSILLMFFLSQLQLMQERLVMDTRNYCDRRLIQHLQGA